MTGERWWLIMDWQRRTGTIFRQIQRKCTKKMVQMTEAKSGVEAERVRNWPHSISSRGERSGVTSNWSFLSLFGSSILPSFRLWWCCPRGGGGVGHDGEEGEGARVRGRAAFLRTHQKCMRHAWLRACALSIPTFSLSLTV